MRVESLTDDGQFFKFCQPDPKVRFERTAKGEIVVNPPAGLDSAGQETEVGTQLRIWAKNDGQGRAYGATAAYILPSTATYSPDAWVSNSQLRKLSKHERARFPHLVPEFVIEVRSPSDRLPRLKSKMQEWIDNGVQLAWLIDASRRTVTIYRPNQEPQEIANPESVDGEGPVAGFRLELTEIWEGI